MYVNVGGKESDNCVAPVNRTIVTCSGSYDGDGTAFSSDAAGYISGGGGATHIAMSSGVLSSNKSSILIVAGGGAGSGYYNYDSAGHKGYGGTNGRIVGNNGIINTSSTTISLGETQSTGASFGLGETPPSNDDINSSAGRGGLGIVIIRNAR